MYPNSPITATPSMFQHSRAHLPAKEPSKDIGMVQDVTYLKDLPSERFSHVMAVGIIGSTADSLKVLREVHRVVQGGGVAGISS